MMIGKGIIKDLRARSGHYLSDWTGEASKGKQALTRIAAASVYIFFASAVPAIAFGQQLKKYTKDEMGIVHTLAATGITGCMQAVLGGQPLLIVGVAEPIVIIYHFLYEYAKDNSIPFVPWSGWVCVWASITLFILALGNAANFIEKFTRFSGEIFGLIIAVLFLQQSIKGLVDEFDYDKVSGSWATLNGVFGLLLAFVYIYLSTMMSGARKWRIGNSAIRAILADYGSAIMIVVVSALSFCLKGNGDVPQRMKVLAPTKSSWLKHGIYVADDMADIATGDILAAIIPGIVIAVLFYFDHSVSSMLAQQHEFKVKKPSAYHYDLLLISAMTMICGMLGLPPVNGVLPQAPLHTRSLCSKLKKEKKGKDAESGEVTSESDEGSLVCHETRISNLVQSCMCLLCMLIGYEFLNNVPTSIIWAFFTFMSLESLPGNQLFDRVQIVISDKKRRKQFLNTHHALYLESVRFSKIVQFTAIQVILLLGIWAITVWTGLIGISFPLWIMALVPFRLYVLPKYFTESELNDLDSSEVEELPAGIHNPALAGKTNGKESFLADDSDSDSAQSVLDDGTESYRTMGFKKTLTEEEIKKRFSQAQGNTL
ncbi:bicarbonate transporter [Chloropicon primus]|uniref:Bicarbonate transporter n=2 Tax=Chloropicon primus TaxID=1764295 RepID=A0A5B8MT54_9CHLO|nr:bicarbonate transporter [Chloropicon primus]UPR01822.1 bicarbonate transporter [Chloropicon primus]|eukprot:QDZ22600.1 bicarbonate transporter [Chloropicon primus]